ADADFGYQARSLQSAHLSHDGVGTEQATGLMDLVQVDSGCPQSPCARSGMPIYRRSDRHRRIELRGEEGVLAVAERVAEDPFAAPESVDAGSIAPRYSVHQSATGAAMRRDAVDLGGVEQGDAKLQCAMDDGMRMPLGIVIDVIPFRGSELPGTEPNLGNGL